MSKINRVNELFRNFGFSVLTCKGLEAATRKIPYIKYVTRYMQYKAIVRFLHNENREIIDKFNRQKHNVNNIDSNFKVWLFWWQGFDNAPELVKICIESIRNFIDEDKIVLLDKDNYFKYVQMPKRYVDMLNSGAVSITQFSDLLRLNLLYQQGGLWLDSTFLLTDILPPEIPSYSFYSIRHCKKREVPVSHGLWAVSVVGFSKHNDILKLILDIYNNYYTKRTILVEYLLTDHIFATCYDYCEFVRKEFDKVPINNTGVDDLLLNLNKRYTPELYKNIVVNTSMHKLNRKIEMKKTIGKDMTLWGYIYAKSVKEN